MVLLARRSTTPITQYGEKPPTCDERILQKSCAHEAVKEHQAQEGLPTQPQYWAVPKVHTAEKPFKCSNWGTDFLKSSTLLSHLTHPEERLCRCPPNRDVCKEKSVLVSHQKIHTREISCVSQESRKTFSHTCKLKKHHKIHSGKRPYKCMECRKAFCQSYTLNQQQKVQAGGRP
ncbi:hypothetical protein GH733_017392 [Mirounga leonina]|nr:hypothetical protein GH733_017392 [Mirounga leonina]